MSCMWIGAGELMTPEQKVELAVAQLEQLHIELLNTISLINIGKHTTAISILRLKRRDCETTLERLRE